MKKSNLIFLGAFLLFLLTQCAKENKLSKNEFNKIEASKAVKNQLAEDDILDLLQYSQKAAWPRIKVTLTWGGFITDPNVPNPCAGGSYCGLCFGLCIQFTKSKSKMMYEPETLGDQEASFNYIDRLFENKFVLIPNSNVDNGDGTFNIEGDCELNDEIYEYLNVSPFVLKGGSYSINYIEGYDHGVIVIDTENL